MYIFLLCILSVGIFSCEEDNVNPDSDSLRGKWDIEWRMNDEILRGDISFSASDAVVTAYGTNTSSLLSHPEYAMYTYRLYKDKLVLVNHASGLKMEYVIKSHDPAWWEFEYLEDIQIRLSPK